MEGGRSQANPISPACFGQEEQTVVMDSCKEYEKNITAKSNTSAVKEECVETFISPLNASLLEGGRVASGGAHSLFWDFPHGGISGGGGRA